jgi:sulfhydrogenase subunit beta (sulfur reductase)
MPPPTTAGNVMLWLDRQALQGLIDALAAEHRVVGPRIADGTVVYADLSSVDQLPAGWVDEQDGGSYRLHRDADAGCFDHVPGPHSLKTFLFPPRETLEQFVRTEEGWRAGAPPPPERPLAVIGVRACDLAALAVQDRVFLGGDYVDPAYRSRRERLFVVAVNCRRAAATCFCHSLDCGPAVNHGFDLALTETGGRFALEAGSPRGADIARAIGGSCALATCTPQEEETVRAIPRDLGQRMQSRTATPGRPRPRRLATEGIRDLLYDNLEHPRWQEVADRCLACGNCTLVCPTCFCASVADVADLAGDNAARERRWASCFSPDHSQLHDRTIRPSVASRYRQWLTHKLAGWIDQFGTSGCTGCGRCITWCPVGIDLTEEVAAIRGEAAP